MSDSLHTINGKPVSAQQSAEDLRKLGIDAAATAKVKVRSEHTLEAGDVGNTGDHGDLGSNGE